METPHPGTPYAATPAPAIAPGALSPDGVWRWDGLGWVPANPVMAPAYRPLGSRPRVAAGVLLLAGLSQIVNLGALTGRLDLLNRIGNGAIPGAAEASHSDDVVRATAILAVGMTLLCAVVFLMWLHRVVGNNGALGARALRFSPGAAVGWWFVPLANWVTPVRVVGEAWRAADPRLPHSTPDQRAMRPLPAVLVAWWLAFVAGSALSSVANLTAKGTDLDALHSATVMFMISCAALAVAAVLGAMVVTQLSRRQDALRDSLSRPAAA